LGAEDIRAAKQRWYQEHKAEVLIKNHARYAARRDGILEQEAERNKELRTKYVSLMGGKCQRCGYSEFLGALAFHHVDPNNKIEQPQRAVMSGNHDRAIAELSKCVLLCFNCHQGIHAGEWAASFVKRDGLGWTIVGR